MVSIKSRGLTLVENSNGEYICKIGEPIDIIITNYSDNTIIVEGISVGSRVFNMSSEISPYGFKSYSTALEDGVPDNTTIVVNVSCRYVNATPKASTAYPQELQNAALGKFNEFAYIKQLNFSESPYINFKERLENLKYCSTHRQLLLNLEEIVEDLKNRY